MLNKVKIRADFSNAAKTYEANSDVQKQVVHELLHRFTHLAAPSIDAAIEGAFAANGNTVFESTCETVSGTALDIGCGTGTIGRTLLKAYPALTLYSADIAEGMIKKLRQLSSAEKTSIVTGSENKLSQRALCAESEALPFYDSSFDYCFSSLAYQWVDETEAAFNEAYRVLCPDGLFLFSTLGPDTLRELRRSYELAQSTLPLTQKIKGSAELLAPYKTAGALKDELKRAGFKEVAVENRRIEKSYASMFDLLGRLKKIGAFRRTDIAGNTADRAARNGTLGHSAATVKEAARIYSERFPDIDSGVKATYDVLYVSAVK